MLPRFVRVTWHVNVAFTCFALHNTAQLHLKETPGPQYKNFALCQVVNRKTVKYCFYFQHRYSPCDYSFSLIRWTCVCLFRYFWGFEVVLSLIILIVLDFLTTHRCIERDSACLFVIYGHNMASEVFHFFDDTEIDWAFCLVIKMMSLWYACEIHFIKWESFVKQMRHIFLTEYCPQ